MNAVLAGELYHREQRTLGVLIGEIEALAADPFARVLFDFCGMAPNGINAHGFFGDLALGYADLHPAQLPKVEQLLKALMGALHQTFHYPGGSTHRGDLRSPLWVGNPGEQSHTVIVGVSLRADGVILHTDNWEVGR